MSTTPPIETLGDRIRQVRSARGWSQAHLAELAGMKKAQLSRYEVGASAPRPEVLHRIASALGVSHLWLGGSDVPINSHEIPEGPSVPLSPRAIDALFAIATKTGLSITEAIELAVKEWAERMDADASQSSAGFLSEAAAQVARKKTKASE